MKKSQILGFFIIYVSLSIFKILSKSETWSPESVRFGMEHTIYIIVEKKMKTGISLTLLHFAIIDF